MLIITPSLRDFAVRELGAKAADSDPIICAYFSSAIATGKLEPAVLAELAEQDSKSLRNKSMSTNTHSTKEVFGNQPATDQGGGGVRVKAASEQYRTTKSIAKHAKTGEPIINDRGRQVETQSELEFAKAGVLFKYWASRKGVQAPMNDHEKALLNEIFEKDTWSGDIAGRGYVKGVSGLEVKALLNDSVSGGANLNPEWFDEAIVTFPLLSGELFPFVTVRDVPRGSSVEGASVGNPTFAWGNAEGTEAPIFDTDGLVDPIDTTIHDVTCVVEVGKNLMADSVANLGQIILQNIGMRAAAEWDRVIAVGNGTTQPEGIFNASGISTVTPTNVDGDPTVADYEGLLFAIGKQYRGSAYRCAYLATDTTYSRARGIAVGASDQRRVFGMDHQSYTLLDQPYRVQNDIGNSKIAFGALSTYRLYRRQSLETQIVTEDFSLARANKIGIVCRARMGGRIVDTNAWAKITSAKA